MTKRKFGIKNFIVTTAIFIGLTGGSISALPSVASAGTTGSSTSVKTCTINKAGTKTCTTTSNSSASTTDAVSTVDTVKGVSSAAGKIVLIDEHTKGTPAQPKVMVVTPTCFWDKNFLNSGAVVKGMIETGNLDYFPDHNGYLCKDKYSRSGYVKVGGGMTGRNCGNVAIPEDIPTIKITLPPTSQIVPASQVLLLAHLTVDSTARLTANATASISVAVSCTNADHTDSAKASASATMSASVQAYASAVASTSDQANSQAASNVTKKEDKANEQATAKAEIKATFKAKTNATAGAHCTDTITKHVSTPPPVTTTTTVPKPVSASASFTAILKGVCPSGLQFKVSITRTEKGTAATYAKAHAAAHKLAVSLANKAAKLAFKLRKQACPPPVTTTTTVPKPVSASASFTAILKGVCPSGLQFKVSITRTEKGTAATYAKAHAAAHKLAVSLANKAAKLAFKLRKQACPPPVTTTTTVPKPVSASASFTAILKGVCPSGLQFKVSITRTEKGTAATYAKAHAAAHKLAVSLANKAAKLAFKLRKQACPPPVTTTTTTTTARTCPSGKQLVNNSCVVISQSCPTGQAINSQGICAVVVATCPTGYTQESNGNCVAQNNNAEQTCEANPNGYWNTSTQTCTITQINCTCCNVEVIYSGGTIVTNQEGNCNTSTPPTTTTSTTVPPTTTTSTTTSTTVPPTTTSTTVQAVQISCIWQEEITGGDLSVVPCTVTDTNNEQISLNVFNTYGDTNSRASGVICTSTGTPDCPSGGTFNINIVGNNSTNAKLYTYLTAVASAPGDTSAYSYSEKMEVDPSGDGF